MAKAGLEPYSWPKGLEAKRFRGESFGAPWRRTDPKTILQATSAAPPARH